MSLLVSQNATPSDLLKIALAIASNAPSNANSVEIPFPLAPLAEPKYNLKRALVFQTKEGGYLFEANAIARYLVKGQDELTAMEKAKIDQWLELEEEISSSDSDQLPYEILVDKLAPFFTSQSTLIPGKKNTFADLVLWSHFSAHYTFFDKNDLKKCQSLSPNLARWYENHASLKLYQMAAQILEKKLTPLIKIVKKAPKAEALAPLTKISEGVSIKIVQEKEILPIPGQKNFLITSALPYVNNVPHLGNIIGCVLSADVFARYCRLRGYNAIYICGTDEYGTATETKALEEGLTCQEICDKYHVLHKQIYDWFEISFDKFGRTTTTHQTEIAQDIFLKLNKNGYLKEGSMIQLWCPSCLRYLADRYVEGTCPHCAYKDARGDQCDQCGKLLNAEDLVNPRCKLCSTPPEKKNSDHMFLDLPQLQQDCEDFVDKSFKEGEWSPNGYTITQNWFKEGLKPRCITRDLKWGTPVPLEKMKEKVFYVWFDAPIGYLSITANYTSQWEKWWKNPDEVKLYQFMGKDNVPFHTVIFPSSLIGAKDNYTLLHHVSTTEYLNYEGGKFSKSRGVGVFGNQVMDTGIPASVWRFCLLINRPETNDSQFTWNDLMMKNNSELLAKLGNFVNRTLKFLKAKFRGQVQEVQLNEVDHQLIKEIDRILAEYVDSLETVKIRDGLKLAIELSDVGNDYLTANKLDNTLFENEKARCGSILTVAVNMIYFLSSLLYPYMPSTSQSITEQLHAPLRKIDSKFSLDILPGHVIGAPFHLFSKIEEEAMNKLKEQYKGKSDSTSTPGSVSSAAADSKKAKKGGKGKPAPEGESKK